MLRGDEPVDWRTEWYRRTESTARIGRWAARAGICAAVSVVTSLFMLHYEGAQVDADTDSNLARIASCPKSSDMIPFLEEYLRGMDKHGLTEGTTDPSFPSKANSYREHRKTITQTIARCREIGEMDPTSSEYQLAERNLKASVNAIPRLHGAVSWKKWGWSVLMAMTVTVVAIGLGTWWTSRKFE